MIKKAFFLFFLTCLVNHVIDAQEFNTLRQKIKEVIEGNSATVGVALWGSDVRDTLSVNGNKRLPMQSVYKFHLALAVLDQVDQGKLNLDQVISIDKSFMDTYQKLWSPLRKKYPDGVEISLAEVIRYTVAWSDNVGCDKLFELVGGTKAVHNYMRSLGIENIAIKYPEIVMQNDWDIQYKNWTTPLAANQVLRLFHENKETLWSKESHQFLLQILKDTQTGKKRIRGLLPESTVVAHKTGYSGKNDTGLSGAVNNIGIVFLPDNNYFYISVFVSDSMESDETNQEIIARIAKVAWDYFNE